MVTWLSYGTAEFVLANVQDPICTNGFRGELIEACVASPLCTGCLSSSTILGANYIEVWKCMMSFVYNERCRHVQKIILACAVQFNAKKGTHLSDRKCEALYLGFNGGQYR